jgi:hypothetical protein
VAGAFVSCLDDAPGEGDRLRWQNGLMLEHERGVFRSRIVSPVSS